MSQTSLLIRTLKQCLKENGLTYADIAKALALSETSVKRLFAEESLSLKRLDKICAMLNLEITDLARRAEKNQTLIHQLSEEQEKQLTKNPKLLLIAYHLLHNLTYDEILSLYAIDEHEGIRLLAQLDKLKFIQCLPGNRVKVLTSHQFTWRKYGPIQEYFNQHVRQEFLQSDFMEEDATFKFAPAMASKETIARFHQKIDKLVREFNEQVQNDSELPLEKRFGCSMVLALRRWEFSVFAKYRKT
ncbi:MAG: helix-turn-helix domain-containing protein [Pseudomonadota bacterium]